ncbi:hypothetical protein BCR42DRAFT_426537 [Absidia repens]|uniref:Uncharacterized protein n=1 Tax=Absidia repens TaxID=90262 RepID=A0A1X2I229_9FUNG|nr:hypothetical protein BCR42DRAFT_426537 [Absidia repens]
MELKTQQAEIEKRKALLRENKERQRLEMEQKQRDLAQQIQIAEQAATEERERLERQRLENEERARREREIREAELARQRRAVIISQAKKRYMTQLVASVLEEVTNKTVKEFHRKNCIAKRYASPWLRRVRQRIAVRHRKADERIQVCKFSQCFYPGNQDNSNGNMDIDHPLTTTWCSSLLKHKTSSIDSMIHDKVMLSLHLESSILASYNTTESSRHDIWQSMDYADSIYPMIRSKWDRIRTRMIEDGRQPGWQLWINVADHSLSSSHWFKTKFGLNDIFSRRVKYFSDCKITVRSITNDDSIYGKAVDEIGAVIFSLSELRHRDSDDLDATDHWNEEKKRLQGFAASLKRYNPQLKAPFLFTYWPNTKSLKETIMKIPKLLDLAGADVISDFHILVMNPATINERLDQEIHWLSSNTVINQPLKTNHVITSKIRALTFAVEKTSCNFRVGITIEEAIHSVNKQIEAYNNTLVEIPLNWKPFVIPSIPEQSMGNREATRGDFFVLGNAWLDIVSKKGIVKSIGGAEDLGAVVDGTLKQYLYELERRLKRPLLW